MTAKDTSSEAIAARAARLAQAHQRAIAMRAKENAAWSRVRKQEDRLVEDAARAWRPDLEWKWHTGHDNGLVVILGDGLEMYADVCPHTGRFHVEIAFGIDRRANADPAHYYRREDEVSTKVIGAGLGATLADAFVVALANYNEARAVAVPDAGALLAAMEPKP